MPKSLVDALESNGVFFNERGDRAAEGAEEAIGDNNNATTNDPAPDPTAVESVLVRSPGHRGWWDMVWVYRKLAKLGVPVHTHRDQRVSASLV